MNETVYRDPAEGAGPAAGATPPTPPDWRKKAREPLWMAVIAAAVVLMVGGIFYLARPEPKPVILGSNERSIALSENGKILLVATLDSTLRLVATESGHTLTQTILPSPAIAVCFGPDNTPLVLPRGSSSLYIYSSDLSTHSERTVQPNARDLIWSQALGSAIVASGGADNLNPSLEFFPAEPMGIANSTSQSADLRQWSAPANLAASAEGTRIAVTLQTNRRANVIFYDPKSRRVAASSLLPGRPRGVVMSKDGDRAWVVSPEAESVTEITAKASLKTEFPRSASTSPLLMIAVNESARRAYTTGSLTFAEVDLDQKKIVRTFELPTRSAGIVLSPDASTAYLTFQDANRIGVLNLQDMKTYHEIELR